MKDYLAQQGAEVQRDELPKARASRSPDRRRLQEARRRARGQQEAVDCLQPDRRVEIEVLGSRTGKAGGAPAAGTDRPRRRGVERPARGERWRRAETRRHTPPRAANRCRSDGSTKRRPSSTRTIKQRQGGSSHSLTMATTEWRRCPRWKTYVVLTPPRPLLLIHKFRGCPGPGERMPTGRRPAVLPAACIVRRAQADYRPRCGAAPRPRPAPSPRLHGRGCCAGGRPPRRSICALVNWAGGNRQSSRSGFLKDAWGSVGGSWSGSWGL